MLMVAPRGRTKEDTSRRAPSRSVHSILKGSAPTEEAEEKDETKAEEYCRRVCPDFSLSPSVQFPEEELSERVERLLDKIKKTMKEEDVSNGLDKI